MNRDGKICQTLEMGKTGLVCFKLGSMSQIWLSNAADKGVLILVFVCLMFLLQAYHSGLLQKLLGGDTNEETEAYDYDLIVIGGGSGGLACSKVSILLGAYVI